MRHKRDLLIAIILALGVHIGLVFAHVSVEYPRIHIRKDEARQIRIAFVTPSKNIATPRQKSPPVRQKKVVPRKKEIVQKKKKTVHTKTPFPKPRPKIENHKIVVPKTEVDHDVSPQDEEINLEIPTMPEIEPLCSRALASAPLPAATIISPAVPRYKENTPPAYPRQARRKGYEGIVLLSVMVLDNGTVSEVRIKESSGHSCLDAAALRTVKQWVFEPATRLGTAIPMWVEVPVRFTLKGHMHS